MKNWIDNDLYVAENLIEEDAALQHAIKASIENGLPDFQVSPAQGKFLYLLAKIKNAKRILELGTLGGYSTIWLARALPDDGTLISLEYSELHADVARKNIEFAGLSDKVMILQGPAADSMNKLIEEKAESFDMIFIDADKPNYPLYFELSLRLSKSGTVIYADNVIRCGDLDDEDRIVPVSNGAKQFIRALGKSAAVESIALQTVDIKGHDGFSLSIVK